MTRAAIEAAKNADYRRYEAYTALWGQDALEGLENEIGEIQKVMRPEVEEPVELLELAKQSTVCLLYTSPSPRDGLLSRMPSSA